MNPNLKKRINELADAVREVYDISIPIVNMSSIVKKLGGELEYTYYIAEFADGKIEKVNKKRSVDPEFKITISEFQSVERKRFSVAHELGHLFLHMGFVINEEEWNKTEVSYLRKYAGEMEYQANEFAAAFLMPRKEFREIMMNHYLVEENSYDIYKVASHFNVSIDAATNRGRWLGYLAWG